MDLSKAWCKETAHPSYQSKWSKDNPSYGQCLVTALVMQDIMGGEIWECKVKGKRHYVNIGTEGGLFDYTRSQFGEEAIVYEELKPRTRASLLKSQNVKERYTLLKSILNW